MGYDGYRTSATTRTAGLIYGVVSALCFGGSGPMAKALIDAGFSAPQAAWLRISGAAVILVGPALVLRRDAFTVIRRHPVPLIMYGLLAVAGCQALYYVAASRLPVGIAILLEFTGPILVVGWLKLVQGRHVPRTALAGVLTALIGLACVVQIWSGIRLDLVGLAAGLGAAAGNASYFLIIERLSGRADPLVLTSSGMVIAAVALLPIAMPWNAPWHLLTQNVAFGQHSAPGWLPAVGLVVVSTIIAYLTGSAAIQRLSAPVGAGVAYLEAVAATLIAWVALGERLTAAELIGGAIVLAGAFIAQLQVNAEEPAPGVQLSVEPQMTSSPR